MEHRWSTSQRCTAAAPQVSVVRYRMQQFSQHRKRQTMAKVQFSLQEQSWCTMTWHPNWAHHPPWRTVHTFLQKGTKLQGKQIIWFIKWVINRKSSWKIRHWEWSIKWALRWEIKSVCWKLTMQQWEERNNRWRRCENCGFHRWVLRWYLMHWKETTEKDVSEEQHYFTKLHCN